MRTNLATMQSVKRRRQHGVLQVDLLIGLAILAIALMPLGFSFARERKVLRSEYYQGVINELVDGEMEILAAGAANNLPDGTQNLAIQSQAAAKLPPGIFQLTKAGNHLQLEWLPTGKCGVSKIVREATLK